MTIWNGRRDRAAFLSNARANPHTDAGERVSMRQSMPVEVDGIFLGAAVEHELGVRFIAVDPRVTDMHQSIWPNVDYAKNSARQLYRSNRSFPST
jgi:hypothetical protein